MRKGTLMQSWQELQLIQTIQWTICYYLFPIYICIYIHFGIIYFQYACVLTHVWLFTTLWTAACQAPLSMGFSRQEYYSGLLFPPPGDFSNPGIKPSSPVAPALQADSLLLRPLGKPREPLKQVHEEACASMLISSLFVKARFISRQRDK